ncbi:MAG: DNA mismatch repair protein [Myxococcales bacterium]|nr:DNA mismatch repair protein [Myxococcales bacterium]
MSASRNRSSAVARYLQSAQLSRAAGSDGPVEPVYGLPALTTLNVVGEADAEAAARCPDLLHAVRSASIDHRAARRALDFAFTAGDSAGIASHALGSAALAESSWRAESFEHELFIGELIDGPLSFGLGGRPAPLDKKFLRKLLCNPPAAADDRELRQGVLRELDASPELLEALQRVYGGIVRLLRLYDESGGQSRYDQPRWRLDVLACLRECFDALQGPFSDCRSALSRLRDFGCAIGDSQGYAELVSLLDFEGEMARVDLHLCLGVDGRVRRLEIIELDETRREPFYRGPLLRLLSRIGFFLRGYRVGDVELVERYFDRVYAGVLDFIPALLQLRGDLEFYLSACHFAKKARELGLAVCLPDFFEGEAEAPKHIDALFNPLLLLQSHAPVPCTLEVDSFRRACIVTGPNSGGKTRLLQALALAQMMGQAGYFVAARSARLRTAPGIFVSLGQDSSAEQQEGRLGTELLRIRRLFESARPGALVILDELCSGTNPSEGEEIFHLVVDLLRELRPEVYITTHFLQFAAQLAADAETLALCFLQVELDDGRLPTYQFIPGVATTSLAHQTAARLGVSREELLALIRRHNQRN